MTARGEARAVRLAWGIGLYSLALVVASAVLLALDWRAIDSLGTAEFPYFLGAPITGILGVLIAARRPRNPIGWLLLAITAGDAIYLLADFVAIRGLLAGASPGSWVAWPACVFNDTGNGVILLGFVILLFPNGRLLPGPRWRWAARVVFVIAVMARASSVVAVAPIQLSPRLPNVPNPLAVPALDRLTSGNGPVLIVSFLLLFAILVAAVVVRFRRSRGVERRQMR